MPRIHVLALTPELAAGGAEMWLTTLINHARNATYTVITPKASSLNPNCRVIEIGNKPTAQAVAEYQGNVDLILYWGHGPMDLSSKNVPIVFAFHASVMERKHRSPKLMEALRQAGVTTAHFAAAVSESSVLGIEENLRAVPTIIHNGSDVERVCPIYGGNYLRESWGIPLDSKVMLYNGRLAPGKGADVTLRATEYLPEDWLTVIHGWGPLEEQLKKEAASWPGRVFFPQARIKGLGDLYDLADVVAVPSESEAFSLALVEAFQAGKRVVVSEYNTVLELERKYNGGVWMAEHVPCPATPREVAEAVLREERPGMVERSRDIALREFSASAMVGRWEMFFQRCLAEWHHLGHVGAVDVS